MQKIKTILFDMDGVVIDSERLHLRAMGLTLEQHGIVYTQSFLNSYIGRSDESFFRYVYEHMDNRYSIEELIREKVAFFDDLLKELRYIAGFPDFIQKVKTNKLQTGLVTSSSLLTVQKVDRVLNVTSFFDNIITEEDTEKHKPNPDPYLLALENLGADSKSTLVIEDSINGILAGKAARCRVAGITTSFGASALQNAGADYVIDSFSELSIENDFL